MALKEGFFVKKQNAYASFGAVSKVSSVVACLVLDLLGIG